MPQPLSNFRNTGAISIANGNDSPAIHRPELALKAAHLIALHSILENFVTMAFMKLLNANGATATTSAAIFNSIRSASGQRDALEAAAKAGLQHYPWVSETSLATFAVCRSASKERNKVAHWVWGHAANLPDAVLLVDPTVISSYFAALDEAADQGLESPNLDKSQIMVYRDEDFDGAFQRLERARHLIGCLP